MEPASRTRMLTPVLMASCLIILVSFAIRATFGVFQLPIAQEFNWPRAEFSLAIALQNLAWGFGQPIFGAIAERFGDRRALVLGALTYAVGLALSSIAVTSTAHQLLEVLVGFGVAGTGFGVILAIVGRASTDKNRSMSLAIATAAGSAGQIVGPLVAEWLLTRMPWQSVFLVFASAILLVLAVLPAIQSPPPAPVTQAHERMGHVLRKALPDPTFIMIFLGFFSCGYQLGFITAHFPAFITELCGPIPVGSLLHSAGIQTTAALGALAISVIGLTNIVGTLSAGWLGKHYPKKMLLAAIYALRTLVAAVFISSPVTPTSVLVFSALMGALWLATVPLTSGLVAQIYGLRYMGTLYGIVFFSHQLGSFLGVMLGGNLYDALGNYTLVWWIGVGAGAFSALIHLPLREHPSHFQPA